MIDENGMKRLRALVKTIQDTPIREMPDWQRVQQDSYTLGFDDGQIQAGNDLEVLLDDLSGIE